MNPQENNPRLGAENLLINCIGVKNGDSVIIIKEPEGVNYYDEEAPDFVAEVAQALGATVTKTRMGVLKGPEHLTDEMMETINSADHAIFFSRIGDQVRFTKISGKSTKTMCYALDLKYLGSPFCTVPHQLLESMLGKLEDAIAGVKKWRITCPLGTDVSGTHDYQPPAAGTKAGFTLLNFPIGIFRPISCSDMSGKVVLSHWLTASGNSTYNPDYILFKNPVVANVRDGRIAGFEGDPEAVKTIEEHYARVSGELGIDPDCVHSWHAGINGHTYYTDAPTDNLWRWTNLTFSSPRRLHFHTCGNYPPGEIGWSIYDQTVSFDGMDFWRDGRMVFLDRPELQDMIAAHPRGSELSEIRVDIGI